MQPYISIFSLIPPEISLRAVELCHVSDVLIPDTLQGTSSQSGVLEGITGEPLQKGGIVIFHFHFN